MNTRYRGLIHCEASIDVVPNTFWALYSARCDLVKLHIHTAHKVDLQGHRYWYFVTIWYMLCVLIRQQEKDYSTMVETTKNTAKNTAKRLKSSLRRDRSRLVEAASAASWPASTVSAALRPRFEIAVEPPPPAPPGAAPQRRRKTPTPTALRPRSEIMVTRPSRPKIRAELLGGRWFIRIEAAQAVVVEVVTRNAHRVTPIGALGSWSRTPQSPPGPRR